MLNQSDYHLQALDEYFASVQTHHHTNTEVRILMAIGCATVSDEGDSRIGRHDLRGRYPWAIPSHSRLAKASSALTQLPYSLTPHSLTH